jgi:mono/diheme cytochrome c family protein
MRGIMLPNSNVIFYAEGKNPADIPPARNASGAVNPLEGTYGKWEAVENSSLAISEAAALLMVPGRLCSNGRPVPVNNPDWPRLVEGLRSAGLQAYAAAQTKNQDKVGDAGEVLTQACSSCHVKYRDKGNLEDRCR